MKNKYLQLLTTLVLLACASTARAEVSELRVPLGAGGFGFLPLHMMKHTISLKNTLSKLASK